MDVFTNPPSNTYKVNEKFTFSLNGKSVAAIAITTHSFPLVAAAYTILIQILFAAVWNIVSNLLLWSLDDGDRIKVLGLVTFWNSPDPFSAAFSSFSYLLMFFRGGSHIRRPRYLFPALIVTFLSTAIAVASLAIGIYYPNWLRIQNVAPAHPAEVYFPYLGQPTDGAALDFGSFDRPSILRALGSAEAGKLNTQLPKVAVEAFELPRSNLTHPQQAIRWHYTLTAEELNMQITPDLELRINGSCATEYRWLHPYSASNKFDIYVPWGALEDSIAVSSDEGDNPILFGFTTLLHPEILTEEQDFNRSFAFLALTSQARSYSEGNDPWYLTTNKPVTLNSTAPYKVKEGRPALSCWETTNVCIEGSCYTIGRLDQSPLPLGMQVILSSLLSQPASSRVGMRAGVSSLKSYTGSLAGIVIDAGSSSMVDDMTRLILAGYVWTREIMRDLVLSKDPRARNLLEKPAGVLMPGAAAFVVRSNEVVTLSYDAALTAPILTAVLILLAGVFRAAPRYHSIFRKLALRAAALRATQLFRAVDELSTIGPSLWDRLIYSMPQPSGTQEWTTSMGFVEPTGGGRVGPRIQFNRAGDTELAALPRGTDTPMTLEDQQESLSSMRVR